MDSIILYIIGGIVAIIGGFKAVDWLISQKYKTKDECESCRKAIFDIVNNDRDLLTRLDAKMDLLLKHMKITVGGE
jgi:hypothetical protein|nr:MAG TPA: Protein of unknown function (DUF1043) [Caudoviricetes sp.]